MALGATHGASAGAPATFTSPSSLLHLDPALPPKSVPNTVQQPSSAFLRSPTPHLLTSNAAPTADDAAAIHSAIARVEEEIEALYAHPERFPDATVHLTSCLEFQRAHEPLLSAVRRIPNDVLLTIFLLVVNVDELPGESTVHLWWAITHVSSGWRSTALSLSALWGTLPSIPLTHNSMQPEYLHILSTGLQKSTMPLTLHVFGRAYLGPPDAFLSSSSPLPIHPALEILIEHGRRWKHVALQFTAPFDAADFSARLEARGLPLLTHLRLGINWPNSTLSSPNPALCLTHITTSPIITPTVCTVSIPNALSPIPTTPAPWQCKGSLHAFALAPNLIDVQLCDGVPEIELPWAQLRWYRESGLRTPTGAYRIVTSPSCAIEELCVKTESASVASLPFLQCSQKRLLKLDLDIEQGENAVAVFPHKCIFFYLRMSSLQELRLASMEIATIMRSLSAHSTRNLRTLVLRPPKHIWDRKVVSAILESVPQLEHLELHHVSRSTLHIVSQESQRLVPRLRKLELYYDSMIPLEGADVFAPRRALGPGATPPIQTVELIFETPQDCLDTLFILEGWNLLYNLAEPLRARGKALAIEVSAVGRGMVPGVPEHLTSAKSRAKRIHNVVQFLEAFEVPDVAYLRMLNIPHYLRILAHIDPLMLPDDVHYKLRQRASALLESWKPLFLEEFEMRKWFQKGQIMLQYVQSRDFDSEADLEDLLFEI